ncbi:LysM peptidoglycan-binding domain-containing protein [Sediminibacterium ginsengisoli]|nr:LysM peptidoglycan-binding domain-containing protein [Sediminibacterium ginsengisoli]
MKKYFLIIASLFTIALSAQDKQVIKGTPPTQYIEHKVKDGETLGSIGRKYGKTVAQIAKANKIKTSGLLKKGAVLKIPVTAKNLSTQPATNTTSSASGTAIYHKVAKGENLYKISQAYHKVDVKLLREWNGLKNDVVKVGQQLIVGYIKSNDNVSAVKSAPAQEPVIIQQAPVTAEATPVSTAPAKKEEIPAVKEKEPAATTTPVTPVAAPKTIAPEPVAKTAPADEYAYTPQQGDEGYFAIPYAKKEANATQQFRSGDAATFKTISGWSDRKFYVLINDVAPGTIVRITGTNNKSICAKVLSSLVETKGGTGLLLRMSNSAAAALGMSDTRFPVSVTFFE